MLPPAYDAKQYEDAIYKKWESSGAFKAKVNPAKKPFTIAMPPPNVTGTLHLGHAVMLALEDIMIRHRRMKGYEALWIPGTDHAAIATQNKVEKILAAEGMTREKLGRESFLNRVREFVAGSKDTIRNQIRKMGSSCDWSRERYTLDEDLSAAVTEIFVKMYEDGLVYRGYRIVNWCPRCESTLANDEVEHEEVEGNFYHILYPIKGEKEGLVVATTRPETMLGDTAVAVNPKDKRYKKYIGKTVLLPLTNREIPIIGDSYVDLKTGTGALKVTPAHDPNDFEIGKRHKLATIRIMDGAGRINEHGGVYKGLDRFTAREKVLEDLKAKELLIKIEPLKHNVGHCYRCSAVVEPLTSDQWFIDVNKKVAKLGGKSLKERSLEVVKDKSIEIIPDRFKKTYLNWMGELYDWCISRQIWWGHRIPVWYCVGGAACKPECKNPIVGKTAPKQCPHCGSKNLKQDEDTLDTWFSSGLWTFSTLGWPKQTEDLKYFHPTSMMETGYDILFFWVARMILMTTYATDDIPFQKVYLHGLVRARDGKKMSKSLGNGIDPIEMIGKYGTDALRMSMVVGTTPGNDVRLYEEKIEGFRNFTNKLWNASRFVLSILEEKSIKEEPKIDPKKLSDADQWVLAKLNDTIKKADKGLEKYNIGETGQLLYDFLWNDFCDWYLELSKGEKQNPAVLHFVLKNILHLLHPFMPFVTEEIWSHLPGNQGFLMLQSYPVPFKGKFDGGTIQLGIELIGKIRYLRAENKLDPAKKTPVTIYAHANLGNVEKIRPEIVRLARVSELNLVESGEKLSKAAATLVEGMEIFIPLEGIVDTAKEKIRLGKEIESIQAQIKGMKARLDNPGFVKNAPPAVVAKDRASVAENEEKLIKLKAQWAQF